jgi:hypothetical protein
MTSPLHHVVVAAGCQLDLSTAVLPAPAEFSSVQCRVGKLHSFNPQRARRRNAGADRIQLTSAPCGSGCGLPASSMSCRAACPCRT